MAREGAKLIQKMMERQRHGALSVSFEVSPPNNKRDLADLLESINNLHEKWAPLFYSISWHHKLEENSHMNAVDLANKLQESGKDVLFHFPAQGLSQENALQILQKVKVFTPNIFALKGDSQHTSTPGDFNNAIDVVKFIRHNFGEDIIICVAGYPDGHPECKSYDDDLQHLKNKVDAGANFIITQIVFDENSFFKFVGDCRKISINVPILPGIMIFQDYTTLEFMTKRCKVHIPSKMHVILDQIKHDKAAMETFGISHGIELAKSILKTGTSSGIHFFTFNSWNIANKICKEIGFLKTTAL